MDTADFLSAVKGGIDHFRVEWQTTVRPAAAHKGRDLRKVSSAVCMTGAEYRSLAVNNGAQTGDLPWGEWSDYPYVVTHKGQDYARLYTVDGTIKTIYTVDGEVATRDEFNTFLTPSAANAGRPNGGTVTVKLDNIKTVS